MNSLGLCSCSQGESIIFGDESGDLEADRVASAATKDTTQTTFAEGESYLVPSPSNDLQLKDTVKTDVHHRLLLISSSL